MIEGKGSNEAGKAASLERLRIEVAGLQAVLAGRLIQDRETLLPPHTRESRNLAPHERAFFDVEVRFDRAMARLQPSLATGSGRADVGTDRLRAIRDNLKDIAGAPVMFGVKQALEQFPDTTVVSDGDSTVSSGGDDQTDTSAPASSTEPPIDVQPLDSYSPEDREAALGYFEGGTRAMLEQETDRITRVVHSGGAFKLPNGDLDWDQINNVISGVIFGAALGVGGAAGGALAAVAFLVVPRMLAAIEEGIGDFLIGDIPGF